MHYDLTDASIKDRFDHLFSVISGDRFLKMQGLGKEVPFLQYRSAQDKRAAMEQMKLRGGTVNPQQLG